MNLPDLDESGVYTFESVEDQTTQPSWEYEPSDHSEIEEGMPPRHEVLETIVTSRELASGDNLDGRIARIAAEIDELKAQVGDEPVDLLETKLDSLKSKKRLGLYTKKPIVDHKPVDRVSLKALEDAESRITLLESKIGPQDPPVAITTLLGQLKQKLDLLATCPQSIEETVAALQKYQHQVPLDKVEAVYNRLESLSPLLDSLPQISQRLKSLELLHIDAASSQSFLKDAEGTLRQMKSDIDRWNDRLDKIEGSLLSARTK